jgi:hypothetical protein
MLEPQVISTGQPKNRCLDCGDPAGRFKRCLECRKIVAAAVKKWYWKNVERERRLRLERVHIARGTVAEESL